MPAALVPRQPVHLYSEHITNTARDWDSAKDFLDLDDAVAQQVSVQLEASG